MFDVEMANVRILNGYDVDFGVFETYIDGCASYQDALMYMKENLYQDAADCGYSVDKVSYQEFNWLVFGEDPMIYKFTNYEDPNDVQYSSYRIVEQEF
jgi:hypothetical protein